MELSHHREGTGPPLVLLHGIGCRWQYFGPVIEALAAEREVIAVDLPGFGHSSPLPPGIEPTALAMAGAVSRFLDGLDVGPAHLAGNSLGGAVALEMARAGGALSVCGISPAGFWNEAELRWLQGSLALVGSLIPRIAPFAHHVAQTAAGRTLLMGQMVARPWLIPADVLTEHIHAFAAAPGWESARRAMPANRITDPTGLDGVGVTIAWGDRDRLLFPRQARTAARLLPHARIVALTGCGHLPFSDDPAQVARALLAASEDGGGRDATP